jgi:hypothetical protein
MAYGQSRVPVFAYRHRSLHSSQVRTIMLYSLATVAGPRPLRFRSGPGQRKRELCGGDFADGLISSLYPAT